MGWIARNGGWRMGDGKRVRNNRLKKRKKEWVEKK